MAENRIWPGDAISTNDKKRNIEQEAENDPNDIQMIKGGQSDNDVRCSALKFYMTNERWETSKNIDKT